MLQNSVLELLWSTFMDNYTIVAYQAAKGEIAFPCELLHLRSAIRT